MKKKSSFLLYNYETFLLIKLKIRIKNVKKHIKYYFENIF